MAKRTAKKRPRRKAPSRRKARVARRPKPPKAPAPAARAVEAALAGIAHDIRTPLTGIVALAELLASSDLGQREREWANAIKSGADHLAALSSLIVDAAKADAAGLTLHREPFSPRLLAEAVGEALTARAANKHVETEIAIAPDLPAMVAGDALRLRAALENLADNAVKFTAEGTVSFSAAAEPAARNRLRLVFTLTDSGIGMSAAELKRLFRPFAQANEGIARRYRRRRPRPRLRQAHRQGHGRRSQGRRASPARAAPSASPRWSSAWRRSPRSHPTARRARRRARCRSCAPRTTPMAAW